MHIPISWRRLLLNKRHLLLNRRCLLLNRRRPLLNMSFNRTPAPDIHFARALYLVRANLRQRIEKVMTFGTFIQRTGLIYGHSDFKSGHKSSKQSLLARKVKELSGQTGMGADMGAGGQHEKSSGRHSQSAQSFRENKKVGKQMIA